MDIEEILDMLDDMLDRSWSMPFSNGRCVVEADKVRDLIDDIRLNLPAQIKNAKAIVANKDDIMSQAKRESEAIIRKAEDRARALITNEEVVKQAQAYANEIVSNAQMKAKEIRHASQEFSDLMLKQTEEVLIKSLTDVKNTRNAVKTAQKQLAQQTALPPRTGERY